jgi:hypothetical protein
VERYGRTDGSEPTRLLLPVGGLVLNQQLDVGRVKFHPAGTAAGLIEASQAANLPDARTGRGPGSAPRRQSLTAGLWPTS